MKLQDMASSSMDVYAKIKRPVTKMGTATTEVLSRWVLRGTCSHQKFFTINLPKTYEK